MQAFRENGPPACRIGHCYRCHQTTVLPMPLVWHRRATLPGELQLITGDRKWLLIKPQSPGDGLGVALLPLEPWPRQRPRHGKCLGRSPNAGTAGLGPTGVWVSRAPCSIVKVTDCVVHRCPSSSSILGKRRVRDCTCSFRTKPLWTQHSAARQRLASRLPQP